MNVKTAFLNGESLVTTTEFLKCWRLGFRPVHNSYEVLFAVLAGTRFKMYVVVLSASPRGSMEVRYEKSYFIQSSLMFDYVFQPHRSLPVNPTLYIVAQSHYPSRI
jgi:hypothetical protein